MFLLNMRERVRAGRLTPEDGLRILHRRFKRTVKYGSLSDIQDALRVQYLWAQFYRLT